MVTPAARNGRLGMWVVEMNTIQSKSVSNIPSWPKTRKKLVYTKQDAA
jgi:1,2-phenylacetyl-CoA epoxidase PaaB subunit